MSLLCGITRHHGCPSMTEEEDMNTGILVLIFALELGITPDYTVMELMDQNSFKGYTEFSVGFELLEIVYLKTSVRTNIEYTNHDYLFAPYQADYMLDLGVRPLEWMEVGFRHYCYHPVISGWETVGDTIQNVKMKEEIYLRISGKITLF